MGAKYPNEPMGILIFTTYRSRFALTSGRPVSSTHRCKLFGPCTRLGPTCTSFAPRSNRTFNTEDLAFLYILICDDVGRKYAVLTPILRNKSYTNSCCAASVLRSFIDIPVKDTAPQQPKTPLTTGA